LSEWATDDKYGLSDVVTRAKCIVAAGWEKGRVHPKIGEFLLKNYLGMADRQDINVTESITVAIGELPAADAILARIEARRAERNVTPALPAIAADSEDA